MPNIRQGVQLIMVLKKKAGFFVLKIHIKLSAPARVGIDAMLIGVCRQAARAFMNSNIQSPRKPSCLIKRHMIYRVAGREMLDRTALPIHGAKSR